MLWSWLVETCLGLWKMESRLGKGVLGSDARGGVGLGKGELGRSIYRRPWFEYCLVMGELRSRLGKGCDVGRWPSALNAVANKIWLLILHTHGFIYRC